MKYRYRIQVAFSVIQATCALSAEAIQDIRVIYAGRVTYTGVPPPQLQADSCQTGSIYASGPSRHWYLRLPTFGYRISERFANKHMYWYNVKHGHRQEDTEYRFPSGNDGEIRYRAFFELGPCREMFHSPCLIHASIVALLLWNKCVVFADGI